MNAISLSPDVNDWLTNSRHPRILHVFDRACNLINERREVLSIVTPQIGNGPFNLVVPGLRKHRCGAVATSSERFSDSSEARQTSEVFPDHLNLRSPISVSAHQLSLGDLIIRIADAKLWSPRPDWERLHAKRDDLASQLKESQIVNYLKRRGFDCLRLNHRVMPIFQSPVSNLSAALVRADISAALRITSRLAGLGIGLTPAGDDFIMGTIYAVWIIHPPEIASVLVQKIASTAVPLTTSLSAAWLRSAGRGEAGILWHEFIDALISGEAATIQLRTTKLLSVGHTSGFDTLAGFFDALTCWTEVSDSKSP